jgi:hypothetical protein
MAIGMFVVPDWKQFTNAAEPGMKCPSPTPITMARKIQRVRKRSRKDSLFQRSGTVIQARTNI